MPWLRYLEKDIERTLEPGSPYVPADPGQPYQPARPAYCTTERVEKEALRTYFVSAGNVSYNMETYRGEDVVSVTPVFETTIAEPGSGQIGQQTGPSGEWAITTARTIYVNEEVCYDAQPEQPYIPPTPAQPATPAEWRKDFNEGWNAGAISQKRIDGNFFFRFRVGQATGIAVGIAARERSHHYRAIDFCMRFTEGQLSIYERGENVYGPFPFDRQAQFQIVRVGGEIKYYEAGRELYRSSRTSTGSMIAQAALFFGGDRVI